MYSFPTSPLLFSVNLLCKSATVKHTRFCIHFFDKKSFRLKRRKLEYHIESYLFKKTKNPDTMSGFSYANK